jgi:hypothetical protein
MVGDRVRLVYERSLIDIALFRRSGAGKGGRPRVDTRSLMRPADARPWPSHPTDDRGDMRRAWSPKFPPAGEAS